VTRLQELAHQMNFIIIIEDNARVIMRSTDEERFEVVFPV